MEAPDSPSKLERGEGTFSSAATTVKASRDDVKACGSDWASDLPDLAQGGMSGLATLMSTDYQYNFHPIFENAATEVLLHSAQDVSRQIERLRGIQKKQKAKLGPQNLKLRRRERMAVRKLRRKLTIHFDFFNKLSIVAQFKGPQASSVDGLKTWIAETFPECEAVLNDIDVDDLRIVCAPRGQIDQLILNVSRSRIGNAIMRPFVSKNQDAGNAKLQVYNPYLFLRISAAVSLCLLVIFFQTPVALLSYHVLSREAAVGLALGFCLVFSLFAQWLAADRTDVFYILVFAYGAIIGGNIINFEDN
ncbi:hypothetical protein QBC37DRAFT_483103 [Rhypophila decipiens]|uniref:DUF6594 domain-containing protein n=1 Tax=Rhypophila decipiens TaxID=261697 RepID=A0AAN7B9S4_9PEZI|nr:hypothetical protein QBC37DRAFT_483103 [Rhypophila decipiens]